MEKSDKQEILEAINIFSTHLDKRIDKLDGRMDELNGRMDKLDGRMDDLDGRMDKLDDKMDKLETRVVTKDYLDEKLADLRGDLVVMLRKEDNKFKMLIKIMQGKKLLNNQEAKQILSMEPFAKTFI